MVRVGQLVVGTRDTFTNSDQLVGKKKLEVKVGGKVGVCVSGFTYAIN